MHKSTLKIGIIGGGSISDLHLEAYSQNSHSSIIGICDQNLERAKKKAERYQAPYFYNHYEDMLQQLEIDAVVICTWNNTHAVIAIDALKAGKHVFVEKPLSTNLNEALLIENAVKSSGKKLQVGFVRRFDPMFRFYKNLSMPAILEKFIMQKPLLYEDLAILADGLQIKSFQVEAL